MDLLCPACHRPLEADLRSCEQGHTFSVDDGVLRLLTGDFAERLLPFTETVSRMRSESGKRLLDTSLYESLPCAAALRHDAEWRTRCRDLSLISRAITSHFQARPLRVLDVGAYNGWLSHQLARLGHHVTGIEYFADEYDGLRAHKHYSTNWRAIQMDLTDLSVFAQPFDVVIMNHGLHFFPDPVAQVARAMRTVAEGGLFLAIGLRFWRDPRRRQREVAAMIRAFRRRYDSEMLLRPAPGYLDMEDRRRMEALGVELRPYPHARLANVLSRWRATHPWRGYGVARL